MVDYATARRNMVESQVRPNKITDRRLIAALSELPRESFVPDQLKPLAYTDGDMDLGRGHGLMAPMVLARLLQTARVGPDDVALVIGCASGYTAAVLARLCHTVVALEADKRLAARASATLVELGIDNAVVIEGRLAQGYAKQGPYDVIMFDGSVGRIPKTITDQLAEGGRLVAVVDDEDGVGKGTLIELHGDALSRRQVFDAAVMKLPGFARESGFVF